MKKLFKYSVMAMLGLIILTGCRTSAIYNVQNDPIEGRVSSSKIYNAIKTAAYSKGWMIKKKHEGLAIATLNVRNHMAQVEIPYTNKSFSIKYRNSSNLKYDSMKGTIHSNYNGWIQNLERAINFELSKY